MKKEEISYIAGFYDGEGSLELKQRIKKGKKHGYLLRLRISQSSEDVLKWIKKKLKVGIIHFNIHKKDIFHPPHNQYEITGIRNVIFVLRLILPYLIVKKKKTTKIIKELEKRAKKHRSIYRAVYESPERV